MKDKTTTVEFEEPSPVKGGASTGGNNLVDYFKKYKENPESAYALSPTELKDSKIMYGMSRINAMTGNNEIFKITQIREPFKGLQALVQESFLKTKGAISFNQTVWATIIDKIFTNKIGTSGSITIMEVLKNVKILSIHLSVAAHIRMTLINSAPEKEESSQSIAQQVAQAALTVKEQDILKAIQGSLDLDTELIISLVFSNPGDISMTSLISDIQLSKSAVLVLNTESQPLHEMTIEARGTNHIQTLMRLMMEAARSLETLPDYVLTGAVDADKAANSVTISKLLDAIANLKQLEVIYRVISDPSLAFSILNKEHLSYKGTEAHNVKARQLTMLSNLFQSISLIGLGVEVELIDYAYEYITENFAGRIMPENFQISAITELKAQISKFTVLNFKLKSMLDNVYLEQDGVNNPYGFKFKPVYPVLSAYLTSIGEMTIPNKSSIKIDTAYLKVTSNYTLAQTSYIQGFAELLNKKDAIKLVNLFPFKSNLEPMMITNLLQTMFSLYNRAFSRINMTQVLSSQFIFFNSIKEWLSPWIIYPAIKQSLYPQNVRRGDLELSDGQVGLSLNNFSTIPLKNKQLVKDASPEVDIIHNESVMFRHIIESFGYNPQASARLHKLYGTSSLNVLHPKQLLLGDSVNELEHFKNYLKKGLELVKEYKPNLVSLMQTTAKMMGLSPVTTPYQLQDSLFVERLAYHLSPLGLLFQYDEDKFGIINKFRDDAKYGQSLDNIMKAILHYLTKNAVSESSVLMENLTHTVNQPMPTRYLVSFKGYSYGLTASQLFMYLTNARNFDSGKLIASAVAEPQWSLPDVANMWFGILDAGLGTGKGKAFIFIPYPIVPPLIRRDGKQFVIMNGIDYEIIPQGIPINKFNETIPVGGRASFFASHVGNNKYFAYYRYNRTSHTSVLINARAINQLGDNNPLVNSGDVIADTADKKPSYHTFFTQDVQFSPQITYVTPLLRHAHVAISTSTLLPDNIISVRTKKVDGIVNKHIGAELVILTNGIDSGITVSHAPLEDEQTAMDELIKKFSSEQNETAQRMKESEEAENLNAVNEAEKISTAAEKGEVLMGKAEEAKRIENEMSGVMDVNEGNRMEAKQLEENRQINEAGKLIIKKKEKI